MTNKTKLIDLIKSGNLNLAIELSKGLELDIIELLSDVIASIEAEEGLILKKWCDFEIYDVGVEPWWFVYRGGGSPASQPVQALNEYQDHSSRYLLSKSILNYHKQLDEI
tara:strand:- start:29 stop:358 length:330 start_codon:yes stop_codon:yes gene_type:complete